MHHENQFLRHNSFEKTSGRRWHPPSRLRISLTSNRIKRLKNDIVANKDSNLVAILPAGLKSHVNALIAKSRERIFMKTKMATEKSLKRW